MKKLFAITALVALAAFAQAEVVEDWIIKGGSGAASGNGWIDSANAGRGIDFISATAAQNTYGQAVIAVADGVGATNNIHILAAADGTHLGSFAMTGTGDATLDHFRVATSNDGYIFVNGFAGTVQRYLPTGGTPTVVISSGSYSPITGSSRALEVTGSVADGTCKIFVGRGANVVVFGNSVATPNTFTELGKIDTGYGADVQSIGSYDGLTAYVCANPGSGNVKMKKLTFSYGPFAATNDGDVSGYDLFTKTGLDLNADNTRLAFGEAGGSQDGFALAGTSASGLTLFNIVPAAGLDTDSDAVYDAGTWNLNAANGYVDVCIDPVTNELYGYSSSDTVPSTSGGVVNLKEVAKVGEWNLY